MAHKTFISYKYSEARELRDRIIDALGDDSTYYKGEDGFSDDMSSLKAETIKKRLSDMIYDTTVTIVVISPHMKQSNWIDWEIEYSLKAISRDGVTSRSNGIVGVLMEVDGSCDWIRNTHHNEDGCVSSSYNENYLYDIISSNRFNQDPKVYACTKCQTVDALTGSYVAFVKESDFMNDPNIYVDNAFDKSQNTSNYILNKRR